MALYNLIQELERLDYFPDLIEKGIIPTTFIDYKVIYEYYLSLVTGNYESEKKYRSVKRKARQKTALEFNVSEIQVYKITQKMES